MEEQPLLEKVVFEFSQEGNCVDGDIETIEIRCDSSLGIDNDGGCFYVLKTEAWTIESVQELQNLLDRINKIVKK